MPTDYSKYIPLIQVESETTFRFDGVLYKHPFLVKRLEQKKFNNLITTAKVLEGKPRKNEYYYLLYLFDGSVVLTKNKAREKLLAVKEAFEGRLYDLLLIQLQRA